MGIILNDQQEECGSLGEKWFRRVTSKQTFEYSGPAGSGKTTIARYIMDRLGLTDNDVLFMAYVGKAAMRLRQTGVPAKTIHSSIYNVMLVPKMDENGEYVFSRGRVVKVPEFVLKEILGNGKIKMIFIDEGSMVDERIAKDVLSFGLPVMVTGDLDQLPPVFGNPYFLVNPDYRITKIMRQAENHPIIHLSQLAKQGRNIDFGKYGDTCYVIPRSAMTDKMLITSDLNICPTNKARQALNTHIRRDILGITKNYPVVGDKLICRQNNWDECLDDIYLINGLIGYVEDVSLESFNGQKINIDFRPEFLNSSFKGLALDYKHLMKPLTEKSTMKSMFNKFEFANAISVHLSQGSQCDNVLYYDQRVGDREYYRKLLYTGITRAKNGLILVREGGDDIARYFI